MRESLSSVTALTTSRFPYPGLRPFQPEETDIFFGREDQSDQLLEKLQGETHFLAVLGLSGSGKSSLVRTGLLAGLQRGYLAEAGVRWRVAEMRPGTQPFENLAQALIDPAPPAKPALPEYRQLFTAPDPVAFLAADLRRGRWSVHELLRDLAVPAGENLLLIVDQFEEIFRYYQQTDANQAAAFVELLLASSTPWAEKEAGRHRLYVVITMRSEFIGECARFYQLPEAINQGLFLVPRLMRDQLREAIEGPARVCGGQVVAELVNRLLNDVGTDPDQLPLLQHALMRMWQLAAAEPRATQAGIRLTLQHYEQTGPLTATDQPAALSKHAEEALKDCTPSQQRLAELLFRSLTGGVSSQRDTRRPVTIGEVAKLAAVSWSEIAAVVEMFRRADRCFLLPPLPQKLEETTLIDISHESLIRQWQRLDQWAKAESEEAQMYQRLEDSAQRWDKGEGSLWRSPELEAGLAWRDRVQPTAVWASRYGQHFDLAMRFLEESTSGQVRELQRVTQQKELAMQAINLLTYELVDELATLPRTTPILVRVLEKNVALLEEIFALDPETKEALREKYSNLIRLGGNWLTLGQTPSAVSTYQRALAIAETLAQADPSNTEAQRDLSISYDNIGNVQVQQGNTPAALAAYQKSLAIAETLAQADPSNTQAQRDLYVSHVKIGDVQVQQGNTPAALAAYQKSLAIAETLAQADPSNTQAQRDLSISYNKIGDVQVQQGNTPAALAAYQKSLEMRESLAQADPSNTQAQQDLSVSYEKIGRVEELLGNSDEAKHFLQQAISLVQPLTVQDPQNQILQNDLAEYQSVLARLQGDEQLRLQQPQAAVQSYQQALAISLRLAAVNQHDMEVQRDVYRHYQKLGDAYAALPDPHAAATAYQQALQQLETRWPLVNTATAPVSLARRDWEEIRGKWERVK